MIVPPSTLLVHFPDPLMHCNIEVVDFLAPPRLCRNDEDENAAFVILNEVKNLMDSIRYTTQILRLPPQNDITTQSLPREERNGSDFSSRRNKCHWRV